MTLRTDLEVSLELETLRAEVKRLRTDDDLAGFSPEARRNVMEYRRRLEALIRSIVRDELAKQKNRNGEAMRR